jgi:hypothetical protein
MYAAVVFAVIQALGLIVFAPLVINVKYHFSLDRENSIAYITVYGLRIATVKLENKQDKMVLSINGKAVKRKSEKKKNDGGKKDEKGFPIEKIPRIYTYLKAERIVGSVYLLALIGGNDAMNCAIKYSVFSLISEFLGRLTEFRGKRQGNSLIVPDFDADRLEFDLRTRARINLYQLAEFAALLISLKRRKKFEAEE